MIKLKYLDHITITSQSPEKSIAFYRDVLGMTPAYEWPNEITMLKSGETYVAIAWWNKGKASSEQPPITVDHYAFRVDSESYDLAKSEFQKHGIKIDHESDHGNCNSIYVRDPDNHLVELVCYEKHGSSSKMPRTL